MKFLALGPFVSVVVLAALSTLAPARAQQAPPPVDTETVATMEFYAEYQAAFEARDIDSLLALHADDAVIVLPGGIARGPDEIRGVLEAMIAEFAKPGAVINPIELRIDRRLIYSVWSGETADNVYDYANETMLIEHRLIAFHTFAGVVTPKQAAAPVTPAPATPAPVTPAPAEPAPPAAATPVSFTDAQARQGRGVFGACEACHGNDLAGLDGGPPLKGETFERWFSAPPSDLFTFIHENMPADARGTLTPAQAAAVMAYILQNNGFTAGGSTLPAEAASLSAMTYPAR